MGTRETEIKPPSVCPSCAGEVTITTDSEIVKCDNYSCSMQVKGRLEQWASRRAANIDAIGGSWIEQFVDAGLMSKPSGFYKLTTRHLFQFDRMGTTLADKFVESIDQSKNVGMRKALVGFCIPFSSEGTAKRLVAKYSSIEQLMEATVDDLVEIEDIGDVVAQSLVDFFSDEGNVDEIKNLLQLGVNLNRLESDAPVDLDAVDSLYTGKKVCITGTLSTPRAEVKAYLESVGAKVSSSVSKNTDYLLAGENAGSKLTKAQDLGIEIISEDDLMSHSA